MSFCQNPEAAHWSFAHKDEHAIAGCSTAVLLPGSKKTSQVPPVEHASSVKNVIFIPMDWKKVELTLQFNSKVC